VLIAGGGEQMTLRAVARLADAYNIVDSAISCHTKRMLADASAITK
jgi:hypothetical protein